MLLMSERELFESIVPKDSPFRVVDTIVDFVALCEPLRGLYSDSGRAGYSAEQGLRCLVVQFWEDYSDREMENAVRTNITVRWFCGFSLQQDTPDHSYFGRLRDRIGTKRLANMLNKINTTLKTHGLIGDVFTFIDASALIAKTALWSERDKAIKDGHEKLNNAVVSAYAADIDAKWGAKSKRKIWFGHKEHAAVDMRHGLITHVVSTPANVTDQKGLELICPQDRVVFADKAHDTNKVRDTIQERGCGNAIIEKRNRKGRNKDLNRWRSKTRMPFESTFSKRNNRCRYRGTPKTTFQCVANAIAHNLKKAAKIIATRSTATAPT